VITVIPQTNSGFLTNIVKATAMGQASDIYTHVIRVSPLTIYLPILLKQNSQ
jgi:hypothetical protein